MFLSSDEIKNPDLVFKRFYAENGRLLADVHINKGIVKIGDFIGIGRTPIRISNIFYQFHQIPIAVSKEDVTFAFDAQIPISTIRNSKISYITKESFIDRAVTKLSERITPEKAKHLVGKMLLDDDDVSKFRKLGLSAIKSLDPKLYGPVARTYFDYQRQLFYFKNCFNIDERDKRLDCAKKGRRFAIQKLEAQKQFCNSVDPDKKELCIKAIDDIVNHNK